MRRGDLEEDDEMGTNLILIITDQKEVNKDGGRSAEVKEWLALWICVT